MVVPTAKRLHITWHQLFIVFTCPITLFSSGGRISRRTPLPFSLALMRSSSSIGLQKEAGPRHMRFFSENHLLQQLLYKSLDILRSGGYCPFECFGHFIIIFEPELSEDDVLIV